MYALNDEGNVPAPMAHGTTSCHRTSLHDREAGPMIVCSCAVITDHDIELAVLDIMSRPNAPLPTPGVVYRYLEKRMSCCGCAPLAVETIYARMDALAAKGLICPCACASAQGRLERFIKQPARRETNFEDAGKPSAEHTPDLLEAAE